MKQWCAAAVVVLAIPLWGQGPENVLRVVNQNSGLSRSIGEYYARRRFIPSANICRLDLTDQEEIARSVYEQEIEKPVGVFLKTGRLRDRILYIVTTAGVPLKIEGSSGRDATAASVDSELTLLYSKLQGRQFPLAGPVDNPFFRKRDIPFRHPLFPVYLVTRLAAYDLADVKALIDRSLSAGNRGKVVLDLRAADDAPGNDWLRTAAILLPENRLVIDESTDVLYDQRDVIGYASWGSNDPNRKRRLLGFQWLPGAIVTDYVSTSGRTFQRPPDTWTFGAWEDRSTWFAGSPQSLAADFIEEGATGASGHVYEPYLQMTPRPDYLFPAYLSGRTLAESYYLSIPGLSWMNIVIGDPLCRLGKDQEHTGMINN
jgi:uncharacterized protein (TIGR03790 family)